MASLPTYQTDRQAAAHHLAEAKAARAAHPEQYPADFDWAIGVLEGAWAEVDRLWEREYVGMVAARDLDQLRERLRTLEWAGIAEPSTPVPRACPVEGCGVLEGGRHAPDCWLAEAIGAERDT